MSQSVKFTPPGIMGTLFRQQRTQQLINRIEIGGNSSRLERTLERAEALKTRLNERVNDSIKKIGCYA
ncbi:MAG: hypothetical protein WCG23_02760 [bacterium]